MATLVVEAIYENGVLRPSRPLALKEQELVLLTIHAGTTWVERTAGIMGWKGTAEEAERLAMDPEFDPQESA